MPSHHLSKNAHRLCLSVAESVTKTVADRSELRTVPAFTSEEESWKPSWLKRSFGVFVHADRPCLSSSHNFCVSDALPGNLQLIPTTAMGSKFPPSAAAGELSCVGVVPFMALLGPSEPMAFEDENEW